MICRNIIGTALHDAREGESVNVMIETGTVQPDNPCGIMPCSSCDEGLITYSQSERRWTPCAVCGEDSVNG